MPMRIVKSFQSCSKLRPYNNREEIWSIFISVLKSSRLWESGPLLYLKSSQCVNQMSCLAGEIAVRKQEHHLYEHHEQIKQL